MEQALKLYRKRLIPNECIPLKNDIIVKHTDDVIVTRWETLNPKIAFQYGCSCYFLHKGFKVSKFYRSDCYLLCWYCDIMTYDWQKDTNSLIVTDLLADVIIDPDGYCKVIDLDELAQANEQGLITDVQLRTALFQLNSLLDYVYHDKFDRLQTEINSLGL